MGTMIFTLVIFTFYIVGTFSQSDLNFTSEIPNLNSLVDSKYFVDKSNIVKAFFAANRISMVSAPTRFGKSVNLQIIKKFCEIPVDENGNRVQRESSGNYKLFQSNNLNIYKDKVFFYKHFGKYPVIFIDFQYLDFSNFTLFLESFKELVFTIYDEHKYILNTELLSEGDDRRFRNHFRKSKILKLEPYSLYNRVGSLSSILYAFFNNTKCIILIDGYDHITHKSLLTAVPQFSLAMQYVFDFLVLSLFSNPYVERAFMNARMHLQPSTHNKTDIVHNIPFLTDPKFSPFYGFTENEVKKLLHEEKLCDKLNEVKQWYGGYVVLNSNDTVYNPYSVLKYVEHKQLIGYWNAEIEIDVAGEIFLRHEIQQKYKQLLCNNAIKVQYLDSLGMNHIGLMKIGFIIGSNIHYEFSDDDIDLFLQIMTEHGYFTIVSFVSENSVYLKVPNRECWEYIYSKRNLTQHYVNVA